jgi:hypothetical protein
MTQDETLPTFDVAKLELKPGDILLVRLKGRANETETERLEDYLQQKLGVGIECIVYSDSMVEFSTLPKREAMQQSTRTLE